jgi:hypothetical protein
MARSDERSKLDSGFKEKELDTLRSVAKVLVKSVAHALPPISILAWAHVSAQQRRMPTEELTNQ